MIISPWRYTMACTVTLLLLAALLLTAQAARPDDARNIAASVELGDGVSPAVLYPRIRRSVLGLCYYCCRCCRRMKGCGICCRT
ncbi:hypothetical protein XENTR_v10019561 [Xenopus tropicalis]|nr:hypothetical protein XENTR_v10019561 [Xenopus tropicalis]